MKHGEPNSVPKTQAAGGKCDFAFCVAAEIGSKFEDSSFEPSEWVEAYECIAERLMEVLNSDAIKMLPGFVTDKCVLVCVRSKGFPKNGALVSPEQVKAELEPLVVAALTGEGNGVGKGSISPHGNRSGQLFATVLLLDDLDVAKAYSQQAKYGEPALPFRNEKQDQNPSDRIRQLVTKARSKNYAKAFAEAKELMSFAKQEIIARLTSLLNDELREMPHEKYSEKQSAASWVNGELRQLGLAIRCPKTGHPAILVADVRGGQQEISRFRLEIRDAIGHRKRTWSSQDVPELTLMEDLPREEPIGLWSARIRRERLDKKLEKTKEY